MIPFVAMIRMRHSDAAGQGRCWRLWIPLFLVWLLLLPVVLVLFPVVLVVGLCVGINAFWLYGTVWAILSSMRHTLIEVENDEVQLRLRIV
jgi:hypothetical protein